jgi:hypothetical protein
MMGLDRITDLKLNVENQSNMHPLLFSTGKLTFCGLLLWC